jgi:hypothetical protein
MKAKALAAEGSGRIAAGTYASEVHVERLTRLDRMLMAERREQGFVALRPGEGGSYLIRQNRYLLIDRAKRGVPHLRRNVPITVRPARRPASAARQLRTRVGLEMAKRRHHPHMHVITD